MRQRDLVWVKSLNQLYDKYITAYIKENGDNSGAMTIKEFENDMKKQVLADFRRGENG